MRVLSLNLKVVRESQFNTAGGSEFQDVTWLGRWIGVLRWEMVTV